jgi:hypothetical protein
MVAVLAAAGRFVVTVNDRSVWPAGTVTDTGTEASFGRVLKRVTTTPPGRAGAVSTTVPRDGLPPLTVAG